jgi:iron-only hydrogenase group A
MIEEWNKQISARKNIDVYFEPNYIPVAFKTKKIVTTVHDFSFYHHPEWHPRDRVLYFNKYFYKRIHSSDLIVTDSRFVRDEAREILKIDDARLRVAHIGYDRRLFRPYPAEEVAEFRNRYQLPERFVLFVGSIEPRKNIERLLLAYQSLPPGLKQDYKLVLAGFEGWRNKTIMQLIGQMHEHVIFLGYLTVKELALAYNAAAVFAFPSLYEGFGLPPGRNMEGQIAATLRHMGFNYVFDTQFSADLTIMEEASEFLERVQSKGPLPLITSCSSAWMKYMEQFYPDLIENISTAKSPMSMASAMIKTYFAEKIKVDPKKILSVAFMCCTAKKYEAARPELEVRGMRTTDIVITTRELVWMAKSAGIDFVNIKPEKFDEPLGLSSGAGAIFGVTGGVMEAAIRTAYELYTGETLIDIELNDIRGFKGVKEAKVMLDGQELRLAVAHGLGNAHQVLEMVRKDRSRFHFVEVMGCPGGCIGGGGQPYPLVNSIPLDEECLKLRAQALYGLDREKTIRRSHENPDVQRLYREFLGRPLSEKSHELLHTHYKAKLPRGIVSPELKIV